MSDGNRFEDISEPFQSSTTESRYDRLKPRSLAELDQLPPRNYLVKGLLGAGELSVWFGEPGCGKSFLMLTTALSVARGQNWFGRKVTQSPVLYVAAEGVGGIPKRIKAYLYHHGLKSSSIPVHVITTSIDLLRSEDDPDGIIYWAKKHGCALIVIDTLSRAMPGGNENSPDDMGTFIANCDTIRGETGAHVAIVHHTPKAEKSSPRGHSSLLGAVDVAVKIEKHQDGNKVSITKSKDDAADWNVGFCLKVIDLGTDGDGDPITSCVVEPADLPDKSRKPLTGHKARAMDALYEVLCDGKLVSNRHGIRDNTLCAVASTWRSEFYARTDGTQETKRKAFTRAMRELQDMGKIGYRDGLVWAVKNELP